MDRSRIKNACRQLPQAGDERTPNGSMKMMGKRIGGRLARQFVLLVLAVLGAELAHAQQVALEEIGFVSLPGARFEIELGFSAPPPAPEVFMIENPARLTMDFTNVTSRLEERRFPLDYSIADSLMILEAQGRTRMVVNLTGPAPYEIRTQGNSLIITVGDESVVQTAPAVLSAAQPATNTGEFRAPQAAASDITGLDFRRGENGAGQVVVDMARAGMGGNVTRNGNTLDLEFANSNISADLQMRLDVTDFGTPVQSVSMFMEDGSVVVRTNVQGEFEYLAYQSNGQYIINVMPIAAAVSSAAGTGVRAANFSGERISLNFQDIDIRTVLQILADFNDFSLVVGDNVNGNVTLRLVNVPWDQALDIVLRSRGLGQRLVGTVLYVAPADVIATAELQELESSQQSEALAPLVTEYIQINYAVATDMLNVVQGAGSVGGGAAGAAAPAAGGAGTGVGGILSPRGRASVDIRTNTLIVQDVQPVLDNIRDLISRLDVPVRQVLIEARIVNASTSFGQALGIRWGGTQTFPGAGDQFVVSGNLNAVDTFGSNITNANRNIATAVAGGTSVGQAVLSNPVAQPALNDSLFVDLGLASAPSSIALGYAGNSSLLQLELSALEASGNGEVIAQPKVTTQDQQLARIESGLQIPFQSQAGGTAGGTTTEFITAALSLEVTPQITPDGRIIMLLDIHQDSVVPGSGAVPAISTNSVNTRVLVNNGDTVVLGGVFREEVTTTISKTPLLGDLPYVGNIFKRREESESKTELLIFITPTIINDIM